LLELRKYVSMLLEDYDLAKRISTEGRKRAIELFGKEKIKEEWEKFFDLLQG
jgi:glycosyltransferase involved in cell wall biosynthesis